MYKILNISIITIPISNLGKKKPLLQYTAIESYWKKVGKFLIGDYLKQFFGTVVTIYLGPT